MARKTDQTKATGAFKVSTRRDSGRLVQEKNPQADRNKAGVAYRNAKSGRFIASEPLAKTMSLRNTKAREILKDR